jgi:hypothetical protein
MGCCRRVQGCGIKEKKKKKKKKKKKEERGRERQLFGEEKREK